jgi:hypothetical protein
MQLFTVMIKAQQGDTLDMVEKEVKDAEEKSSEKKRKKKEEKERKRLKKLEKDNEKSDDDFAPSGGMRIALYDDLFGEVTLMGFYKNTPVVQNIFKL